MATITDHDIELLLAGRIEDRPELAPLSAFVEMLRGRSHAPIDPALAARHVRLAVEASRLSGSRRPVRPAREGTGSPRRGRLAWGSLLSGLSVKILAGSVALAAVGAGAATGNLPDPAQEAIADVVRRVGIEIPAPGPLDPQPTDRPATEEGAVPESLGDLPPRTPADSPAETSPGAAADHGQLVAEQAKGLSGNKPGVDCQAAWELALTAHRRPAPLQRPCIQPEPHPAPASEGSPADSRQEQSGDQGRSGESVPPGPHGDRSRSGGAPDDVPRGGDRPGAPPPPADRP